MARIRSVKPEYWHDRKLARSCSRDARLLYVGLWNQADEHSRCNGDVAVVKGQVFPYDDDVDVAALLLELAAAGRVQPYMHESDPFLFLPKLEKHQRLDTAKSSSKFPEPPTEFPDPATVFPESHNGRTTEALAQVTALRQSSGKIVAESGTTAAESVPSYVAGSMEHDGKPATAEPPRHDVEQICDRLTQAMLANDCRVPPVTPRDWRTEARLLLDKDKRPLAEALRIIAWTQDHTFWKKNIHSVPALRKQYDKLRLQMQDERSRPRSGPVEYDDADEAAWR